MALVERARAAARAASAAFRAPAPVRVPRRSGSAYSGAYARGLGGATFTGAAMHRLTGDWPSALRPGGEDLRGSVAVLRARARDLRRNDPYVQRYAALCVENVLGEGGITLQARVPSSRGVNEAASRANEALFYAWAERAGVDGRSWAEVCEQLVEAWRVEGEALLEHVFDPALPFGYGVQVLDADLLDHEFSRPASATERAVDMGVELDAYGVPAAYHVFIEHPAAGGVVPTRRRRRRVIPADRVSHLAHTLRADQRRGVTPLASVMFRLQMLSGTQEALVTLHRIAASKMGFLKQTQGDADDLGAPGTAGPAGDGVLPQEAAPGELAALPFGWEFQAWDPGQPTQQYEPFARMLVREVAAGLGVTYAGLTGDASQGSYSSERVQLLAERNTWRVLQGRFARRVCQPVYANVLRAARLRGALAAPAGVDAPALAAAEWHGRRWGWVDPAKDIGAVRDALACGATTLTRELAQQGLDVGDVLREAAAERALAATLGLALDWGAKAAPQAAGAADDANGAAAAAPPRPALKAA